MLTDEWNRGHKAIWVNNLYCLLYDPYETDRLEKLLHYVEWNAKLYSASPCSFVIVEDGARCLQTGLGITPFKVKLAEPPSYVSPSDDAIPYQSLLQLLLLLRLLEC